MDWVLKISICLLLGGGYLIVDGFAVYSKRASSSFNEVKHKVESGALVAKKELDEYRFWKSQLFVFKLGMYLFCAGCVGIFLFILLSILN